MDATRGERASIVGADRPWQAKITEGAFEDGSGTEAPGIGQSLAGEEIAGMLIADGQGEAPDAVAGGELAFEVGGPQIVGGVGVG